MIGFEGISHQTMTIAQTIVVVGQEPYRAVVYIAGKYAYQVEPNKAFEELVRAYNTPGGADVHKLEKLGIKYSL